MAVLQGITYREFVPQVVGGTVAQQYGLAARMHRTVYHYNSDLDPTLSNVFATAAYRFGHSLISDSLTISGKVVKVGDLFMRPKFVLTSLKSLVEAVIAEHTQRADRWYTAGITNRLFEKPDRPKSGFDLAARNIQRGRDHGLPPYNVWRAHYGLNPIKSFNELPQRSFLVFMLLWTTLICTLGVSPRIRHQELEEWEISTPRS